MAKTVNTIMGEFNLTRAERFAKAFKAAKGKDFTFEDHPIVNAFAKYLLEFLQGEFPSLK